MLWEWSYLISEQVVCRQIRWKWLKQSERPFLWLRKCLKAKNTVKREMCICLEWLFGLSTPKRIRMNWFEIINEHNSVCFFVCSFLFIISFVILIHFCSFRFDDITSVSAIFSSVAQGKRPELISGCPLNDWITRCWDGVWYAFSSISFTVVSALLNKKLMTSIVI